MKDPTLIGEFLSPSEHDLNLKFNLKYYLLIYENHFYIKNKNLQTYVTNLYRTKSKTTGFAEDSKLTAIYAITTVLNTSFPPFLNNSTLLAGSRHFFLLNSLVKACPIKAVELDQNVYR